jgi:hypothetical protein
VDEDRVVAQVQAVVVHLVDVHLADPVDGRHESPLGVPREVAAVEEAERAEAEQEDDAVRVVGRVRRVDGVLRGPRVGIGAGRRRDKLLAGAEALERKGRGPRGGPQRDPVARVEDAPALRGEVAVGAQQHDPTGVGGVVVGIVRGEAVVVDLPDRDQRRELGGAAVVVHVEVGRDEVVYPLQARDVGGDVADATRVA